MARRSLEIVDDEVSIAADAARTHGHTARPTTPLDVTESRYRSPPAPAALVDAVSTREHKTPGKLIAVKRLTKEMT